MTKWLWLIILCAWIIICSCLVKGIVELGKLSSSAPIIIAADTAVIPLAKSVPVRKLSPPPVYISAPRLTKADGKWQIAVDSAPRLIRVDLARQRLLYYRDGELVHEFLCSSSVTGVIQPSNEHPDRPHDHIGVFGIIAKYRNRYSREYHVDMSYALNYHGGHFIHATTEVGHLGHRASQSSIWLSPTNAKTLYGEVRVGDRIEIE